MATARVTPNAAAAKGFALRRCGLAPRAPASSAGGPSAGRTAGRLGCNSSDSGSAAGTAAHVQGPLELKGGALWWQHLHSSASATVTLYGSNFVLQRPRVGGPGLVRAVQQPKPVVKPAAPAAGPPVVWSAPGGTAGAGLALAGSHLGRGSIVIDTDFEVLPPAHASPAPGPTVQPNTTCVGIVWQPSEAAEGEDQPQPVRLRRSNKHPRRTQALRFTCNLCGEVNDAAVNPHAWKAGSVFARCQGCTAVHKLKDNLQIFHELAGPVFPPRELRSNYLVQEILDRIQQNNRN